jgi:hypothetical protein
MFIARNPAFAGLVALIGLGMTGLACATSAEAWSLYRKRGLQASRGA